MQATGPGIVDEGRSSSADGSISRMEAEAHQASNERDLTRALKRERAVRRDTERRLEETGRQLTYYETLLSEADHRVKNSLQMVASMLSLQARRVANDEGAQVLRMARECICSIAAVHEQLFRRRAATSIDLGDYLRGLCAALALNKPANVTRLIAETASVQAPPELAMKAGLLVCELVTNSFKHAYPAGSRGDVRVSLACENERYCLSVEDDGCGVSNEMANAADGGFGTHLVRSIVNQLGGVLDIAQGPGSKMTIEIPRQKEPRTPCRT